MNRRTHLRHRGGDLIGFMLLALDAVGTLLDATRQRIGVTRQLPGRVLNAPGDRPRFRLQISDHECELTGLIIAPGIDPGRQRIVDDGAAVANHALNRPDTDQPATGTDDDHQQRDQCRHRPREAGQRGQRGGGQGAGGQTGQQGTAYQCQARGEGATHRFTLAQPGVQPFGPRHLLRCGFGTHRLIFDDVAVFHDRRGIGIHPVVIAVLAAVFDQPHPGSA